MVKIFLLMLSLLLFESTASAAEADFETARMRLICALSSAAAYSGDTGDTVKNFLEGRGWKIDRLASPSDEINVKIHVMTKAIDGAVTKVFFFTGTEDLKDVGIDVKIQQVPLRDGDDEILVHRGFRDYADAALSGGIEDFLIEYMNNHPNENFYVTGHSLGGAIAMMTAARLADAGADMSRIKIITFGAPSIGNENFAAAFQDKIDLTRIFMDSDPIDPSLKLLGYAHFGKAVKYEEVEVHNHAFHSIVLYLDRAIRNYYDAGGLEILPKVAAENKIAAPVYVAPIKIVRKSFSAADEAYAAAILRDGLDSRLANVKFSEPRFVEIKKPADFSFDVAEDIAAAKSAGCKFILSQMLQAKPIRDSKPRATRVMLEEIIFDLNGFPLAMNTSGLTTNDWTLLEAVMFAQEKLREDRENIFS